MFRKNNILNLVAVGTILSACTTPVLESPRPVEPGKVQVGLYTDMTTYYGGLGLVPTGLILRTGITKSISVSFRASLYGAGMDMKKSFGKKAIVFGFNSLISNSMFSDTAYMSSGWTWVHATWIMSSRKESPSYEAYILIGPYAFLPSRDIGKPIPWGFRVALGAASKNLPLVNIALEYGFIIPINNQVNPFEEYYGDLYTIPYGAAGIFLDF